MLSERLKWVHSGGLINHLGVPYSWWATEGRPPFGVLRVNTSAHVTLWASSLKYGKGLPLFEACGSVLKCPHGSCASGESYLGYPWEPTPLDMTSVHEA